jgi:predicted nucleotidyltransferase
MNTREVIARLRENEAVLRAQGMRHVALFGSRARGDNRPDSDIDILVEIAPMHRPACSNMLRSPNTSPICSRFARK